MESDIMLVIIFDSERYPTPLKSVRGFSELKELIRGKWHRVGESELQFNYNVGTHTNCVLNDAIDYDNMLLMSKIVGCPLLEIFVMSVNHEVSMPAINVSRVNGSQEVHIREPMSVVDEAFTLYTTFNYQEHDVQGCSRATSSTFQPPSYDMCPPIEKVPLLSDGWDDYIKGVGQVFQGGRKEFRIELCKYATKLGFEFKYAKNCTDYIYVICRAKEEYNCQWFVRGKEVNATGLFEITKADLTHNCVGKIITNQTRRITPKVRGSMVLDRVRSRPAHPGKEMVNHMRREYGFEVPYYKARRAIEQARASIFGSHENSFSQLKGYCESVLRTNPGSLAYVLEDPKSKIFKHAFFAFAACLEGFLSCRPMLFVDATFMHGRTKICILSAIAKDGNNGLFPVAFAIVTAENLENWTWFLQQIKDVVKHDKEIFFVSDRHPGLLSAFAAVWDKPNNYFCLYHLHNNLKSWYSGSWKTEHREKMCRLLTDCAYAPNLRVFEERLTIFIQEGGALAVAFLATIPYDKWAVAFAPWVMRYGEMTSNAAESFNNWILIARSLPITYMVDTIRRDVMRWFVERKADASKWNSVLCTRRQDLWNYHVQLSRTRFVAEAPNGNYEVSSPISVEVNLVERKCSCSQWQIHGFPCPHAAAVITKKCSRITEAVEDYFLVDAYKKCYSGQFNPIPDTEKFECKAYSDQSPILSPLKKKQPGRPTKKRKKSYGEVPRMKKTKCPSCGMMSRHDPFTCINNAGPAYQPNV